MPNPFDQFDQQASGPVYGAPPKVEPFAAEDQGFQRAAAARAEADAAYRRERDRIQDAKDAAKAAEPPKPGAPARVPVNAVTGIQENLKALREVEESLAALQGRPQSVGTGTGWLGDTFTQWNDPGGTNVRSRVANIGAVKIHDLSGAAVSASEAPRFTPFVPKVDDNPDIARTKLENFRENLRASVKEQLSFYTPENGYMPYRSPEADAFLKQGGVGVDVGTLVPASEDNERVKGGRLNEQQQAEWEAFLKTNPAPDALNKWMVDRGFGGLANAEDVAKASRDGSLNKGFDYSKVDQSAEDLARAQVERENAAGYNSSDAGTLNAQGVTLGLSDEASGVGMAINRGLQGRDPFEGYQIGRDAERVRIKDARTRMGGSGTAIEIGSSLLSGNVSNALSAAPTLGGRMAQGAKAGAVGGGIAGFGYGQGVNSLATGAVGAGGGALLGAALPVVGQVIGSRVDGLRRLMGRDPALPRRLVNEAMDADSNTPAAAGAMMDDAAQRGSPMMLADTGDNARGLLASVGRQPGASQRLTRQAVGDRQMAQGERISAAVVRDLGPTANIREMGEELIGRARTSAAPIYEKAFSAPGASSVNLQDLATRPAFRKALRNAADLVAEEGDNPMALGFQFNEAGDVLLTDVPSFKTLDYIKRGLDDVVEGYRDKTTGKLVLDGQGRATNATLRTMIARMDKVNPSYAEARAAYAGPAKMKDALEKGAKALSKSPDDILALMKNMGDSEQESFRLGVRKAIVDLIGSKRDGGDKVSALIGTPKSRAALTRVFGGRSEFDRFVATLRDEQVMGQTYGAVYGNSATAGRQAFDATTNDTGLAESAMDAALRGGKDGMWSAAVAAVQKLRDVGKFGAGEAGERTRESIAALLSETDPATLRELIAAAREASRQQAAMTGRRSRRAARVGRDVGVTTGGLVGSMSGPRK